MADFNSLFSRLRDVAEPKRMEAAAVAGGEIIAAEARSLVHVRSGNLRDSIIVSTKALSGAAAASAGRAVTVHVGPRSGGGTPDGFYGHMEEWGTIDTPAHPFLTPAYENKKDEALSVMAGTVRADIARAAKG